jgi:hypothetical protein
MAQNRRRRPDEPDRPARPESGRAALGPPTKPAILLHLVPAAGLFDAVLWYLGQVDPGPCNRCGAPLHFAGLSSLADGALLGFACPTDDCPGCVRPDILPSAAEVVAAYLRAHPDR